MDVNNNYSNNQRYGWDSLSRFITFIGCIFCLITVYGAFIGLLLIWYAYWRSKSKDIINRKKEDKAYAEFCNNFFEGIYKIRTNIWFEKLEKNFYYVFLRGKLAYNYKMVICPRCGKQILLKKGKENTMLLCSRCSLKFRTKIQ